MKNTLIALAMVGLLSSCASMNYQPDYTTKRGYERVIYVNLLKTNDASTIQEAVPATVEYEQVDGVFSNFGLQLGSVDVINTIITKNGYRWLDIGDKNKLKDIKLQNNYTSFEALFRALNPYVKTVYIDKENKLISFEVIES